MAGGGEGVPVKAAMNALATGQFPIRLNEPLASFFATPLDLHEPQTHRRGPGRREFPIGAWATFLKRSA
jgi:hypothetical protein